MTIAGRIVRSLVGLIGLLAILVGIPAALYLSVGNPLPRTVSWAALHQLLTARAIDLTLFIHTIALIGWAAWALFAVSVLVELIAQLSGQRIRIRIPGLGLPRMAAGPLVALLLAVAISAPLITASFTSTAAFAGPTTPASSVPTVAAAATPGSNPSASSPSSQTPPHAAPRAASPQVAASVQPFHAATAQHASDHARTHDITYTVRTGDSLMKIAEDHYGSIHDWRKIADANQKLVGERGVNFLEVGWHLQLPDVPIRADTPALPAATQPEAGHDYTVSKGDTLSAIAADAYGSPAQWPRLYHANEDQISDPNLIYPHEDLTIPAIHRSTAHAQHSNADQHVGTPTTATSKAAPEKQTAPTPTQAAPASNATQAARQATPAPTQAAPTQAEPSQAPTQTAPSTTQAPQPVVASSHTAEILAGSAFLAAGLLSVMAARRRRRAITRKPGQRLPGYTPDASRAVTALRQVQAPLTVAHLDRALRTLSAGLHAAGQPLPRIKAIRLDDARLDCTLAAAAESAPPEPFTASSDNLVWTLQANRADTLLDAAQANEIAAPYPALVTLGQDADGAHLLVDLETVGALAVHTATDDDAAAILAALAFELATSSWADDLRVTIVGACPELPAALGVDRARHVEHIDELIDDLERCAEDARDHLDDDGHDDVLQGRHEDGADAWSPHIVLIGHSLDDDDAGRLAALLTSLPRVAIAAVTTDDGQLNEWALNAEDPGGIAVLSPLRLPITPQRLSGDAYQAICAALIESQSDKTEPAPWWNHSPEARPPEADGDALKDEPVEAVNEPTAAAPAGNNTSGTDLVKTSAIDAEPTDATEDGQQTTVDDEPAAAVVAIAPEHGLAAATVDHSSSTAGETDPERAGGIDPDEQRGKPADASTASSAQLVPLHRPTLLLLGPVDLLNIADGPLTSSRTVNELHEPLIYVYLNPFRSTAEFRTAVENRTSKPDELASRLRRYLGDGPDGHKLFPIAVRDNGKRFYRLHESFYSDWAHLQSLTGDINTASTTNLTVALQLVRGRPLASIAYGLWDWAEDWREEATTVIVDVAYEVADRAISRSDLAQARWAIRQGRGVDPTNESLARQDLRVERLAGNSTRVQQIAKRIVDVAKSVGVPIDPQTIEMLHEIRDGQLKKAQ